MKKSFLFLVVIQILMTSACKESAEVLLSLGHSGSTAPCEAVRIDDLAFDASSTAYLTTQLSLINEHNEVLTLNPVNHTEAIAELSEAGCNDYYEHKIIQGTFQQNLNTTDETNLGFGLTIKSVEEEAIEKEMFYDLFNIYGQFKGEAFGGMVIITSLRGNENIAQNYIDRKQSFEFQETITLQGKEFKNVYFSEKEATIFLNAAQGIIGFKESNGMVWLVQN